MAKQFVFVVHGMGTYPADTWAEPWKQALYENLRLYKPYVGMDDSQIEAEHLEILPISYDAVFEDGFRENWERGVRQLENVAVLGKLGPVFEWIRNAEETDRSIFMDYLLDPLLWFTVPQARQAVIARVAAQLSNGLDRIKTETGELDAHIIAHSLGTSVIHDTLLCISHNKLSGEFTHPRNLRWETLVMVANVSRLLQAWQRVSSQIPVAKFKVHASAVRPHGTDALVKSYINLRHRADPFTWPREFDPEDWDSRAFKPLEVKRYDELKQVHDFDTYIDQPRAHVRIFQQILGDRRLATRLEQEAAWSSYKQVYGNEAGDEFQDLRALLGGNSERKMGLVELAKFLMATVKELKG